MNQAVLESKQSVVSEIQSKLTDSSSTVVAEYRGLSVAEITELRRSLRAEGVEMKVYKNTMMSRAAEAAGYEGLKDILTGPNALAFSEDETAAARVMAKFAKQHKALVLKGGIVEGEVVDVNVINELSALPNRDGMLSMLLSVLNAPVSSFARAVNAVAEARPADGSAPEETASEEPAKEEASEEAPAEEVKEEAKEEEAPAEEAAEEKAEEPAEEAVEEKTEEADAEEVKEEEKEEDAAEEAAAE